MQCAVVGMYHSPRKKTHTLCREKEFIKVEPSCCALKGWVADRDSQMK